MKSHAESLFLARSKRNFYESMDLEHLNIIRQRIVTAGRDVSRRAAIFAHYFGPQRAGRYAALAIEFPLCQKTDRICI